jgi:hypothetical protein
MSAENSIVSSVALGTEVLARIYRTTIRFDYLFLVTNRHNEAI